MIKEFLKSIKELDFPIAHFQFETSEVPQLPYLIWLTQGKDTTFADDENYSDLINFRLELYADAKDGSILDYQKKVSNFLKNKKIAFSFDEVVITNEKMIMTVYEFQIKGD